MAEDLKIIEGNRKEQYESLLPQIAALLEGENDEIANMANLCAALKEQFNWLWIGFYLIKGEELVLGPFQGPVACTRIQKGKGVCGAAWERREALIVLDVNAFPGHIACSSVSKSEIVLPIIRNDKVIGVLDIDSEHIADFTEMDQVYLEKLLNLVGFNN